MLLRENIQHPTNLSEPGIWIAKLGQTIKAYNLEPLNLEL
jgi:hypothetical protein